MTTPQHSPSWYDLLGVAPDASADEVRTAWRTAIADLDPTDRRFATLNQAAEVLLDADRRAAYDAELAPVEPAPEAGAPASVVAEPTRERRGVPSWLLIGLAVAVLVVAGVATWVYLAKPSDSAVEDATAAAQSAAERAVVPILSYDAKSLDESRAAAQQYLTGDYRKEYDKLFAGIIAQNAPSTETVLTAELIRSGIVRAGDDRVEVFVLVNQSRTNKQVKQPQVYKNWVTITMQQVDGDWLVAGMDT
ncbi:hypothetical protein GCM10027062_22090 [Nocardioides hungaricus]